MWANGLIGNEKSNGVVGDGDNGTEVDWFGGSKGLEFFEPIKPALIITLPPSSVILPLRIDDMDDIPLAGSVTTVGKTVTGGELYNKVHPFNTRFVLDEFDEFVIDAL